MGLYLVHHGIIGQKWGVRRFEDRLGHLTASGKKRYNEINGHYQKLKNSIKEKTQIKTRKLTEEELDTVKQERLEKSKKVKKAVKIGAAITAGVVAGVAAYKVSQLAKSSGLKKEDFLASSKTLKDSLKKGAADIKKANDDKQYYIGKKLNAYELGSGVGQVLKRSKSQAMDALFDKSTKDAVSKYNEAVDIAANKLRSTAKTDRDRAAIALLSKEYKSSNDIYKTSGSFVNRMRQLDTIRKDSTDNMSKYSNKYEKVLEMELGKAVRVRDGFKNGNATYHVERTAMQMVDRFIEDYGQEAYKQLIA